MALARVLMAGVIICRRMLVGTCVRCLGRRVLMTVMTMSELSRSTGDGTHRNSHEHDHREGNPDQGC